MNAKLIALAVLMCVLTEGAAAAGAFRLYNVVPMHIGHEAEQAEKCIERLMPDGRWQPLSSKVPLGFYESVVLRLALPALARHR